MANSRADSPPVTTKTTAETSLSEERLSALREIERRALWISTLMIHHANNIRPSTEKSKVGGHQASSASVSTDHHRALFPVPARR